MILSVSINAYDFEDLNYHAQKKVIYWLDLNPLEYEDENGVKNYKYFSDMLNSEIEEYCYMNEYVFDKNGNPIHQLTL
jgi:hypothetical protein